MLDDVAGMGDHAGNQDLALGHFDALEQMILVLVARIGRLEAVGAGIDCPLRGLKPSPLGEAKGR